MSVVVSRLVLYPIKGCRGISVPTASLAPTGLEVNGIGDREWVVVDDENEFLSQRELPRMALVETRLTENHLELFAPGMDILAVPLAGGGDVARVRVWDDAIDAVAQGMAADAWLSRFLGMRARLMRFAPFAERLSRRKYTGATAAPYKFADAFAMLVASEASLADLNARLRARGERPVDMDRFRPNIVIDGVDAFDEDYVQTLSAGEGTIEFVKPCVRCTVPSVDPASGEQGIEPGNTLAAYRNNRDAGGITFGVNGIVTRGAGTALSVGDPVELTLRF